VSAEVRGWVRVGAVLVTYALIGTGIALIAWGCLSALIATAHIVSN
jgi:hypothetical protein